MVVIKTVFFFTFFLFIMLQQYRKNIVFSLRISYFGQMIDVEIIIQFRVI